MGCEKQSISQPREKKEMSRREVGAVHGGRMGENLLYVPEFFFIHKNRRVIVSTSRKT
jgi:hypothetical protein